MIEIKPVSLKVPEGMKADISHFAALVGYSKHAFILEALSSVLKLIHERRQPVLPRLIVMVRAAMDHAEKPTSFHCVEKAIIPSCKEVKKRRRVKKSNS